MTITKIFLEQKDLFSLSYSLSYNKFPYLREQMLSKLPDLVINEEGDVFYGYLSGVDDAIFKYDTTREVMNSDYTYIELMKLRPRDFKE